MNRSVLAAILFALTFSFVPELFAQASLAELPPLRWGADVESGAPFAFKDPNDPDKLAGFEVEIVEAVAAKLGRRAVFVQNNWEGLVEGLKRGDYDVAINGIEITSDRKQVITFSSPYYVTSEVLTVRIDENRISKVADIQGKRVGTLAASLAQRLLAQLPFPMETVTYSEEIHAYNDLEIGRIDAVFLDEPIALYYAGPNKKLKQVGEPVGRLEYGIASRLEDRELAIQVERALDEIVKNGTLKKILERWALWNSLSAEAFKQDARAATEPVAYNAFIDSVTRSITLGERLERYASFLPLLAKGAWMTLAISVVSMALAVVVGLLTALGRLYGPRFLSFLLSAYIEVFRGTPLLIQLFLLFYGLPHIGIRLEPFTAAVIGLGLNYGASEAENYRAGIQSVPREQGEAARALGLTQVQSLRYVVLPQAVRVVMPPVTNDFIALLKDSSLVSVITMVELTSTYGQLASTYFDYMGIGLLTAAVYFLIGLPFVRLAKRFDRLANAPH